MDARQVLLVILCGGLLVIAACSGEGNSCVDSTCDTAIGEQCQGGDCRCAWLGTRTFTFQVNEACSDDLALADCLGAVQAAMDYWNSADCSDIALALEGTTPLTSSVCGQGKPAQNVNLIRFVESSWSGESAAVSLVTTTVIQATGEITCVSIELNGVDLTFTKDTLTESVLTALGGVLGVKDLEALCRKYPPGVQSPCVVE